MSLMPGMAHQVQIDSATSADKAPLLLSLLLLPMQLLLLQPQPLSLLPLLLLLLFLLEKGLVSL